MSTPLLSTVDFLLGEDNRKLRADSLFGRPFQIGVNNDLTPLPFWSTVAHPG